MEMDNYKINHNKQPAQELLDMNIARCTGCRSCEIACSYHHTKKYSPYRSSIKIFRDNGNGNIKYFFTESCNLCKDEQIPACVEMCHTHTLCIKDGMLKNF